MSTIFYPASCEADVVAHVCNPCDEKEQGRVGSLAAIHKTYYAALAADPENDVVWKTGIETGKILIIPDVRGSMSSQANYKTGYGRTPEAYTGRTFTLEASDPNWLNNHTTYNQLQESRSYHLAWCTETKTQISKNPATWKPDEPIEDDVNSEREWKLEVSFTQRPFSVPFDTPVGIFDCFEVQA